MESWGIGTDVGGTSALLGAPGVCGVGDRRWHGTGCQVRRASQGSSPPLAGTSRRRHGIEAAKGWECKHGQGETGQEASNPGCTSSGDLHAPAIPKPGVGTQPPRRGPQGEAAQSWG